MRVFVVLVLAIACGGARIKPTPDNTRVVLSVGEAKGLAHIGALDALRAQGFKPKRIFGNSMGSLVGSLYATAPDVDLRTRYRALMAAYKDQTIADTKSRATKGALIGLGLLFVSGGTLGWETILGTATAGAVVGGVSTAKLDNRRFRIVLDTLYDERSIEKLAIDFGTSYQARNDGGLDLIVARKGNLAEAVSRSVANPFIFEDVKVETSSYLDPGADRSAAVPIDEACRAFPESIIIALNVTGQPTNIARATKCPVIEISVPVGKVEPAALSGEGTEFERAYRAGYDAVGQAGLF